MVATSGVLPQPTAIAKTSYGAGKFILTFTRSMLNYSTPCKFHINFDAKFKLQVMHDFVELLSFPQALV